MRARACVCACGACALACMCKRMRPPLFFLSLTFPNTVYNNEDRVPREIQFAAPTGELEKSFLSHRRGVKKMFFLYTEQKLIKKICTGALITVLQGSQGIQTELLDIFSPAHQHKKNPKRYFLFFNQSMLPHL